jgi:hypothetical protein
MTSLKTILPPDLAVAYLVNLAAAVSVACGVGLMAARLCRRGSAPLQHGVLVWTLLVLLISPAAVWLAQENGLALVRITVSERAAAPAKGLPSPGTDRRLVGRGGGGRDAYEFKEREESFFSNSPHPNPLPEGEGTRGLPPRGDFQQAGRPPASSRESYAAAGRAVTSARVESAAPAWW